MASAAPRRAPEGLQSSVSSLASLLEHGVARRLDLAAWCASDAGGNAGCASRAAEPWEKLEALLTPVRAEAVKVVAMEELIAREEDLDADALEYGEVDLRDLAGVLRQAAECSGAGDAQQAHFWDLGSGCGKVVFAAAATGAFTHCYGVELLRNVSAIGNALVDDVRDHVLADAVRGVDLRLFCGDALHGDAARWWPGAVTPPPTAGDVGGEGLTDDSCDGEAVPGRGVEGAALVVYCDCTLFDDAGRARLAHLAERGMPPGACIVTALLPLPTRAFRVIAVQPVAFSWGEAEVVIQRRRARGEAYGLCARCFDNNAVPHEHADSDDPTGSCPLCGWLWCRGPGCRVQCATCGADVCSDCSEPRGTETGDVCIKCAPPPLSGGRSEAAMSIE